MSSDSKSRDLVMAYIAALDRQHYDEALERLHERVRIRGPTGEAFGKPLDFIEMHRKYRGKYDDKKVFLDSDDECVLYDLKTERPTESNSKSYQVKGGKIVSIQTVFDPRAFGPPPKKDDA